MFNSERELMFPKYLPGQVGSIMPSSQKSKLKIREP